MPMARGTAGINADPSCKRQAIFPVFSTTRFAADPRNIPKAVKSCQLITTAPLRCGYPLSTTSLMCAATHLIGAGEFSAA